MRTRHEAKYAKFSAARRNKPVTLAKVGERYMGIRVDNVAELIDRSRNDVMGQLTEIRQAIAVELLTGPGGKVWINIDGVCVLRIEHVDTVIVDTTNALSTDKVTR